MHIYTYVYTFNDNYQHLNIDILIYLNVGKTIYYYNNMIIISKFESNFLSLLCIIYPIDIYYNIFIYDNILLKK